MGMPKVLWSEYGAWLLSRVGFRRRGYILLMDQLHITPFSFVIARDRNRATDGVLLREEFYRENEVDYGVHDHRDDCHVLEMLVALAIRIEEEYTGEGSGSRPDIIFWEMIQNLELDAYDDREFDSEEVEYILDRWMEREFDYNGHGSIFPIRRPIRDQRDVEIWSQMNEYLMGRQ